MESETMSSVLASVSSRKEKASKALASLHSHRTVITSCITDWEELERSFGVTERALQQKFKELTDREKDFDGKMQDARAVLDKREESIAGLEETSLARVKEQKVTALAAIAEERSNFEEKRIKWQSENQAAAQRSVQDGGSPSKGESKDDVLSLKKDASNSVDHSSAEIAHKKGGNQDLGANAVSKEPKDVTEMKKLTKVSALAAQGEKKKAGKDSEPAKKIGQQLKDEGVKEDKKKGGGKEEKKKAGNGNETAKKVGQHSKGEEVKEEKKKEDQSEVSHNKRKVSTPIDDAMAKRQKGTSIPGAKGVEIDSNGASSLAEEVVHVADTQPHVQIKVYFEKMDCEGLRDFLVNRKDFKKLRTDLLAALQASNDPCLFLLKLLEGSEDINQVVLNNKTGQVCILLLECLSEVVADPVLGADYPVVPSELKEMARIIGRRWISKLERHNQDVDAVGSHLFLQLLASFGIAADFTNEQVLNSVVAMSHRARGPALTRSLGLTDKVPVVVDRLVREGKQIEAITFASAFNLSDKLDIATLMKSYLEDSRRENKGDKVGSKGSGRLAKQITALKNVVKVIEEHKLDYQFPLEELRVRISVLSQERAEKKANSNKEGDMSDKGLQGFDKGVFGEGNHGRYGTAPYTGASVHSIRGDYVPTDIGRPLFPPYNVDNHHPYDRRPESVYDGYDVRRNHPSSLSNPYVYASRDRVGSFPSGMGASLPPIHPYGGISRDEFSGSRGRASYPEIPGPGSNYQLGSGLPPPSSSYLPYYLR